MSIITLDHIQIAMPKGSEPVAREFYSILGFTEVEKPLQLRSRGGCWFMRGNIQVHLGVEEDFRPAKKAHPAFRVDDIIQWEQHLRSKDITITPDTTIPTVRRFYVSDPFGNRIEFIQEGDKF